MEKKRFDEIAIEGARRADLWLENESIEKMTCGYSMMRFDMSLGLNGYCFPNEQWMEKDDFKKFITDAEFDSPFYDIIIQELFNTVCELEKQ